VFRAGETYAFSPDITEKDAHKIWVEMPSAEASGLIKKETSADLVSYALFEPVHIFGKDPVSLLTNFTNSMER